MYTTITVNNQQLFILQWQSKTMIFQLFVYTKNAGTEKIKIKITQGKGRGKRDDNFIL